LAFRGDSRSRVYPRLAKLSAQVGNSRLGVRSGAASLRCASASPRNDNLGRRSMLMHFKKLALTLILACVLPAAALAQAWPQRPIKMIVPFPAGGGTDFIGRLAAKHLSEKLGQQVVVENRGGANGAIGLTALMGADPDGYTIAAS